MKGEEVFADQKGHGAHAAVIGVDRRLDGALGPARLADDPQQSDRIAAQRQPADCNRASLHRSRADHDTHARTRRSGTAADAPNSKATADGARAFRRHYTS